MPPLTHKQKIQYLAEQLDKHGEETLQRWAGVLQAINTAYRDEFLKLRAQALNKSKYSDQLWTRKNTEELLITTGYPPCPSQEPNRSNETPKT